MILLVAVGACDAVTGSPPDDDGGIYVRYVGSEAGVYDAYCFPVQEEPEGRIVEIAGSRTSTSSTPRSSISLTV